MAKGLNLKAILGLDTKPFQQGIGKLQQQLAGIGTMMKGAFAIGSAAIFGKSILMATKNYEDAMARVQAVSNATNGEFEMMNKEALKLGATTRYTATQVAETLEVLTRNGFSASKATAVLSSTLKLAQANAVGLSEAGNIITTSLNMFGLSVKDVQKVTDVMSSTVSNTATNLQDFYAALVNAAPMAHALGISIQETAAAIGTLANRGILAQDAGTQIRMALQKMVDSTALKKMKELGLAIDENKIKSEGLTYALKVLSDANLSVSQLNDIFTVRSSKAVLQLVRGYEDYVRIYEIVKKSSEGIGTTMRMFQQGVGSVRKEIDILRSVWENLMITIGTKTKGPILGVMRALEDFITNFRSGWGKAINLVTAFGLAFSLNFPKIQKFFKVLKVMWNEEAAAEKLNQVERNKVMAERIAKEEYVSQRTLEASKKYIAAKKTEMAVMKQEQAAAKSLSATLTSIAGAALWTGLFLAFNKIATEIKNLHQAERDLRKEQSKLQAEAGTLISVFGDGDNPDTVNGVVKRAIELFPRFADALKSAYLAASKTGEYKKLKKVLQDIYDLQSLIAARDAQEGIINNAKIKLGQDFVSASHGLTLGGGKDYRPELREIRKLLKSGGWNNESADKIINSMADVVAENILESTDEQLKSLRSFIQDFKVKVPDSTLKALLKKINDSTNVSDFRAIINNQDLWAKQAKKGLETYKESTKEAEKRQNDLTWDTEFELFLAEWKQAAKDFGEGTKEFKDQMAQATQNFVNAVKDINLTEDQKSTLEFYQKQFNVKGNKGQYTISDGGSGSGSGKKTEWEKFTDLLDEYPKKVQELENQLKNGAITQAEYDKEITKLNLDTWKAIAAISDLDSKMKSLSKAQIDTINTVKDKVPQDPDVANAYSELVNALHDFDKKKIEIINKNEQGAYTDPSVFVDALMDLEDETYKNIASLKGLDKAVVLLNAPLKKLYNDVTEAGKANKDYAERLKKLETPNTLPPKFEGRDAQDIIKKRDQYADVVNLLNEYEKQRLKLDTQRSKGAITGEQYDKNLAVLNGVVGISLRQFRSLNEIVVKLPDSLKNLYDEINNFKLPETDNAEPVDESSFIKVLDDYYDKSLRLLEQKVNGSLDDTTYEKELQKLAKETIKNIANFDQLDKIVAFLPKKYQDVYNALVKLKEKIENTDVNAGDNTGNTTPKTPTVPEAAPTVEVNPVVNVTVNVDGEEVGKNINVTVDTEKDETENKDLIDEIKKWQKAVEKASKSRQQIEIEEEVGTEKIEIQLELKQDEIERIQKRIQEIMSSGEVGEDGITILTDNAMKELNELMAQLKKAMNDAETLGEMKTLASGIVQLQSGMDDFSKTAIDNISNVASAFDRLMDAIESIASAFGAELEWEGLKKVMSVINGTIQVMEALRSIIVTVQAVQDIATKKKLVNSGKEVVANMAVASSEGVKAGAAASAAAAEGAESVAGVPIAGPALAVAAVASIVASLIAAFASLQKFESGGILQGSSSHGDKQIYRGNKGEMILNRAQQGSLYRAIAEGRLGGGNVEFIIRGDTLVGILKNHNRKWN